MSQSDTDRQRSSFATGASLQDRVLRVLQITDTHLYANPNRSLLGLNTLESLDQILERVRRNFLPADMVLATGDLAHDSTAAGYARFAERLSTLKCPVYCLPGNHDVPRVMRQALSQGFLSVPRSAQHGQWSFVFLDSTIPNQDGGSLRLQELEALEQSLAAQPDKHTLVCLHHQPIPVGSVWMDSMALANPTEFFDVIARHPQVRGVLCGHIHQDFDTEHQGVRLIGSPSTCIQFKPGEANFAVDDAPPGFRWLLMHPDGRIRTGIERLESYPSEVDRRSAGY